MKLLLKTHVCLMLALLAGLAQAQSAAPSPLRYAGSDTVEPLIEATRAAYMRTHPDFKLTISSVGTSSGLRELCTGRVFFAGASRAIKPAEASDCAAAGVKLTEIPVALDAVAVVVSAKLPDFGPLTMADLKKIFAPNPGAPLVNWRQIRADLPDTPLLTAGVDIKHGTFEFFHTALGNGKFARMDIKSTTHHDDSAKYVISNPGAVAYVSLAVANDYGDKLRIVPINFGAGPVVASVANVRAGSYAALSRRIYVYLNLPAVAAVEGDVEFMRYLVGGLEKFSTAAGLTPLKPEQYQDIAKRVSFKK